MKNIFSVAVLIAAGVWLASCESPCSRTVPQSDLAAVNQTQLQADLAAIDQYLIDKGITALTDASGIRYTIDVQGAGSKPCLENSVSVRYTGRLLTTGAIFDSSGNPVSFRLNDLILGWRIMLPQTQGGSTVTLYIPSGYAYGARVVGSIPANANLIFTIELIR